MPRRGPGRRGPGGGRRQAWAAGLDPDYGVIHIAEPLFTGHSDNVGAAPPIRAASASPPCRRS